MKKICVLSMALLMSGFVSMVHAAPLTHTVTIVNKSNTLLGYLIVNNNANGTSGTVKVGTSAPITYQIASDFAPAEVKFWGLLGGQDFNKVLKNGQPFNAHSPTNKPPATATTFTVTGGIKNGLVVTAK
jgi:hypothetical protein